MRTGRGIGVVFIMIAPTAALAQQSPPADSVPHAGQWGAEAVVTPSTTGASLLRFRSPTFAWVVGADFLTSRSKSETSNPLFGSADTKSSYTTVGARLGMRWYRGSQIMRLRPVVGAGALGTFHSISDAKSWRSGLYGELGAVYFVGSHVSLGGAGELQASYTRQTQESPDGSKTTATATSVSGSLARLLVSVYF